MIEFVGTVTECEETLADADAALGYPKTYTQADLDNGVLVRVGGGPGVRHVPVEDIRVESSAVVVPRDYDPETGEPAGAVRRVSWLAHVGEGIRPRIARRRVLRLLNRGSREALIAVPGIGPARADQIIAARTSGRMTDIKDVRNAGLPPAAVQALRDYVLERMVDEDTDEDTESAQQKRRTQ